MPKVEVKPKGCYLKPGVPTEQKTWPLAHLLSVTRAERQPLTGCDLDRWTPRHVLFMAKRVGPAVCNFTAGSEIITQA